MNMDGPPFRMINQQPELPGWERLGAPNLWNRTTPDSDRIELLFLDRCYQDSAVSAVEELCMSVQHVRDTPEVDPAPRATEYAAMLPTHIADNLYRRDPDALASYANLCWVPHKRQLTEDIDTLIMKYATISKVSLEDAQLICGNEETLCGLLNEWSWRDEQIDRGYGAVYSVYAELIDGVLPPPAGILEGRMVLGIEKSVPLVPILPHARMHAVEVLQGIAPALADPATIGALRDMSDYSARASLASLADQLRHERYGLPPRTVYYNPEDGSFSAM